MGYPDAEWGVVFGFHSLRGNMKLSRVLMLFFVSLSVASCDVSKLFEPDTRLSMDDSKAVGAACRHSGRALEDCFSLNPNAYQSGVFEGWRDMNDYMMANKIETVAPKTIELAETKPNSEPVEPPLSVTLPSTAAGRPKFEPAMLEQLTSSAEEEAPIN